MPIRWVILSDLHLGADQTILTADDGQTPSPVAVQFAACLRELAGGDRPTLVLAGDAIELALAQIGPSFTAFERFMHLLYDDEPVFADRIVYVPGNHDHDLWKASREQAYMNALSGTPLDRELPAVLYTSALDPHDDLPLAPLMALFGRDPATWKNVSIDAVYPNLALRQPGVDRTVIVHHGHLVESIYSAMSGLGSLVFDDAPPASVEEIERDNNSWINFLWSELGRSGRVGTDLQTAYHLLPNEHSVRHIAAQVAERLADRWGSIPLPKGIRRWLVRGIVTDLIATAQRLETHHPDAVLSPDAERGLRHYLDGPLRTQLTEAGDGDKSFAFVFGHTHKPYQQMTKIDGWNRWVPVYNTGGWVNEQPVAQHTQGAQAIVVDDELNVMAVEFYRQQPGGGAGAVRVREPLVDDAGHAALHAQLVERVQPTVGPWARFSAAVAHELAHRRALLETLYQQYQ
jgi:UDP-2,3-diacylglucosamine pyrophosphatase LpxH